MEEQYYWLGFNLIPEIGPVRIKQLEAYFGSLENAWRADTEQLQQAGMAGTALNNLVALRQKINLDAEWDRVNKADAVALTTFDKSYPALLQSIPDAPPVLFVRGQLVPEDSLALAIVGTRKPSHYGREVAFKLARQLVEHGVTIVSGLAHGIDTAAHQGAIAGKGRTIAVLGCGVDIIYPRDNTVLAQKIIQNGAIVSEFGMGTPPTARNFPRRNRIISGLSLGVLIAEAPESSGALITAESALEQGREVFAVPGNIFNPSGRGSNKLIQEGAKLVMRVRDILDELNVSYNMVQTRQKTENVIPADETEASLLQHLGTDPIHIDDLVRMSGLPAHVVTSTLTILELKGLAQNAGHMQYCRARH